jgi:hypothetical protein
MAKGQKSCPKCNTTCGPRTKICKNCNHSFEFKTTSTPGNDQQIQNKITGGDASNLYRQMNYAVAHKGFYPRAAFNYWQAQLDMLKNNELVPFNTNSEISMNIWTKYAKKWRV